MNNIEGFCKNCDKVQKLNTRIQNLTIFYICGECNSFITSCPIFKSQRRKEDRELSEIDKWLSQFDS